jgi:protein phosphatase
LAVDTFLHYFRQHPDEQFPNLLINAVQAANYAVLHEARQLGETERMACTLVAAATENGSKAYIANVGDSRAYLCRAGQLRPLTRDHTFANVMVWLGKLSAEAAAANPEANRVMRVIGTREDLQVDLGFYLETTEYGPANQVGRSGLALKRGDSILLCSDGLIKLTPRSRQKLITEAEVASTLDTLEGDKAAQAVLGVALGRIPVGEQVDNITVAVVQMPDPNRGRRLALSSRRNQVLIALAVGLPLLFLLVLVSGLFAGFFVFTSANAAGTATQLAQATLEAADRTRIAAGFTATPTLTPTPLPTSVPTAVPGEIAKVFSRNVLLQTIIDVDRVLVTAPNTEPRYVAVTFARYNMASVNSDGNVYLRPSSQLQFNTVTEKLIQFTLLPGSEVVVQTGPYARGAEIHLARAVASVRVNGCMALRFLEATQVEAICLSGKCGVSPDLGQPFVNFNSGTRKTLTLGPTVSVSTDTYTPSFLEEFWPLLNFTTAGEADAPLCRVPNVSATSTAVANVTASAVATRATQPTRTQTATPTITSTPNLSGGGNNLVTSVSNPTATPSSTVISITRTPTPIVTATESASKTPTATPTPTDTDTPEPTHTPTDAPPPTETDTPEPTATASDTPTP